ncbi:hypothetical protein FOA43_004740 [Brettanomyces nanus]|uniref:Swiss Army Knife RNA repair protein HAD domain-containing protein n=1 Tax=Eeniella nana TaxID=13502 RepID=A0A875S6X9_EENNA|nr:uncharacterized protein FOA43_004740 [Brettanomyces nanus]QPG77331.1 hypothetical protein FOA43_004740 [Brettanomyces nanus]
MKVDIFKFDNTLFKTPLPNYELFSSDSIDILTDQSPQNFLNWFRDYAILSSAYEENGLPKDASRNQLMWNEPLVDIARDSIHDPNTLTVLYASRPDVPAFQKCIHDLTKLRGLLFDLVHLSLPRYGIPDFIDNLTDMQPDVDEINYYANVDQTEDNALAEFMYQSYANIDFYRIPVAFQRSYINPTSEFKLVLSMVSRYNRISETKAIVTRSRNGTVFRLPIQERKRLLQLCMNGDFISKKEYSHLKFDATDIPVTTHQLSREDEDKIGRLGEIMEVVPTSMGCIPGRIYVVKVQMKDIGLSFLYSKDPLIVIAYDKSLKYHQIGPFIRQIRNYKPFQSSSTFEAIAQFSDKLRIKLSPKTRDAKMKNVRAVLE